MLGLEAEIIYKKPTSWYEWTFAFGVFGPVVGMVQVVFLLIVFEGPSTIMTFPFALVSSFIMFIPAATTGFLMFLVRNQVTKKCQIFLFSLIGAILTYLWFTIPFDQNSKHDSVLLIMIIVSYITTVFITSMFYYRKEE